MSQTATRPAPVAPGAAPTPNPSPDPAARAGVAPRRWSTPRLLRGLTAGLVVLGTLAGLLGLAGFLTYRQALGRAQDNAAQLVRVQQIQADLLAADALATNAFLVGGLEPTEARARYDAALTETTRLIAAAADAQPADGAALAALNDQVIGYAATVEQARANNRQGFPVGAQYLRNASATLRAEALPLCSALVAANTSRTDDETRFGGAALALTALVVTLFALAAVIATMVLVARRFRRTVNVGLGIGAVALLVGLLLGGVSLARVSTTAEGVRNGSATALTTAAAVRIAANDAKADESLTLIARGSGAAFEESWQRDADTVGAAIARLQQIDPGGSAGIRSAWDRYATEHRKIRALDDEGRWDQAVALATSVDAGSPNERFTLLDRQLAGYLGTASEDTVGSLGSTRTGLLVTALALALLGVGAAAATRRGLASRLEEYR